MQQKLYDAVEGKNIASVKKCLDEGVDINEPNEEGYGSLHLAASDGYVAILKILAEQAGGADLTDGWTLLCIASENGHVEVVEALIEQGDDVVDVNKPIYYGETPIWIASRYGHDKVVRVLSFSFTGVECGNNELFTLL